ncbi:MAG: hypothetical protein NWE94_05710 [Candidatus Bathyarchaeota archaeon]|nr:hypothetical protein [Candidatus Bathyarchaeota archaeon]
MNKPVKLVVVSLLVCMVAISVGSAAALNGYQNGDLDRVQLREQLQDGSCCETEVVAEQQREMTQQQTREQLQEQLQERLQDGSCGETQTRTEPTQEQTREQLQEHFRDQFRERSGGETEKLEEPVQERSQLREQVRYGRSE